MASDEKHFALMANLFAPAFPDSCFSKQEEVLSSLNCTVMRCKRPKLTISVMGTELNLTTSFLKCLVTMCVLLQVKSGLECGFSLGKFKDFEVDDVIECVKVEYKPTPLNIDRMSGPNMQ